MFFFVVNQTNAQWSFALKGTYNQSWYGTGISPFKKGSAEKRKGIGTSIQLYYHVNQHFSFGAEPGFIQRGATAPTEAICFGFCGTGVDFSQFPYNNAAVYTDHLQLPLMARFSVRLFKKKLELSAKAGYGFSYATGGYQQSDYIYETKGTDILPLQFDETDNFNRWDAGMYSGLMAGWQFRFGTLFIETERYRGLTNANSYFSELRNQSTGYSLGYRLAL